MIDTTTSCQDRMVEVITGSVAAVVITLLLTIALIVLAVVLMIYFRKKETVK